MRAVLTDALEFSAFSSELHVYLEHIVALCIKDSLDMRNGRMYYLVHGFLANRVPARP
jgi:hypothetical protein